MHCKNCGEPIQEGYSFCMNCGQACDKVDSTPSLEPTQMNNPIEPKKPNNKKTLFIGIAIVVVVIILVGIAIFMVVRSSNSSKKESSNSNSSSTNKLDTNTNSGSNFNYDTNTNTNINANSNTNTNTNSNMNTNANSNTNTNTNNKIVGSTTFGKYTVTIPSEYEATISRYEFLGDILDIDNPKTKTSYQIEFAVKKYSEYKANEEEVKKELGLNIYDISNVQYKTYNGKEYLIVSKKYKDIYSMCAYVAIDDQNTILITATDYYFNENFDIFKDIAIVVSSIK